jgi:penicillin-binding protein 1B
MSTRLKDWVLRLLIGMRSPFVLIPGLLMLLIGIGLLYNYYVKYSEIIDSGLRGDLFVRTSGIYAAPLDLQEGATISLSNLVRHLQQIGYVESGQARNEKRGSYRVSGTTIEVTPGSGAVIDGQRPFRNLRITFGSRGQGGQWIDSILDLEQNEKVVTAQVEPELISSVTNKDREKRKIIDYEDLPAELVNGIVSIEDRQFFEHPGINWRGILRALIRDYQAGAIREGGSSITQQLVKNIFLFPDRTWKRKLAEAYMSLILEQRLSKEEILAMYSNQIYLGQRGGYSINGFGQAARTYFGKDISNLELHESAMLAGIIRSPNYYSPYSNEERARGRRNMVLEKMVEAGKLDAASAEFAKQRPLGITGRALGVNSSDAPYFTDYLMRQLERQYEGDEQSLRSLRIYSTIDLNLQRAAYEALTENMAKIEERRGSRQTETAGLQAALVAMNARTGEILALVGGRDYSKSQLNRATDSRRQPGSVFKPFVYAAALEVGENGTGTGITAASLFNDIPQTFEYDGKAYQPGNFGEKYENRPITVREALVNSKNVITVEIAQRIGFAQVKFFAEKAGIPNVPPYPSSALGTGEATPLQIAAAYTSFANEGMRVAPIAIRRVTTRDGATLFESKVESRQVMSRQLSFLMTSILQDVLTSGTGTRVRQRGFRGTAAGKTGSSRDAWFAGYTPNLVTVVWIGYDNNRDIGMTGGETAAPIWADFMTKALGYRPDLGGEFLEPEDIEKIEIDPTSGLPAAAGSATTRTEYFLPGTRPGDGEALPDASAVEPDSLPNDSSTEYVPRPTPTPFKPSTPRDPGQTAERGRSPEGSINDFIPAPPRQSQISSRGRAESRREESRKPESAPSSVSLWERLTSAVDLGRLIPARFRSNSSSSTNDRVSEKTGGSRSKPSPGSGASSNRAPAVNRDVVAPAVNPEPAAIRRVETGGFYLEVCDRSGLLPTDRTCRKVRRRFRFGNEPVTFCNTAPHR